MAKSKKISAESFENLFRELEATVSKLEAGDLALDESLALFQRGMELAKKCGALLDTADSDLESLAARRAQAEEALQAAAARLTTKRQRAAGRLAKAVEELLPGLGMPEGEFSAAVTAAPGITPATSYPVATTISAWDGTLLGELGQDYRVLVPFDRIPAHLVSAFLAAEDRRFYEHAGLDARGLVRALLANLRSLHAAFTGTVDGEEGIGFDDFLDQMKQVRRMGPIGSLLGIVPGLGQLKQLKGVRVDERELDRIEAIVTSMTAEERRSPQIIDGPRRKRIAAGSGTTVQAVNQLIKQLNQMQRLMRQLQQGKLPSPEQLMRGL
jgi:exodeoxyribonuclease VII small subunit